MLKSDAIKLCQENNFNAGYFEGSDNNGVVDAYELKVIFAFHSVCVCLLSFCLPLTIVSTNNRSDLSTYLRGLH